MEYRREHDSMGEVLVPADALWGAQTQRSHENFPIGAGQTLKGFLENSLKDYCAQTNFVTFYAFDSNGMSALQQVERFSSGAPVIGVHNKDGAPTKLRVGVCHKTVEGREYCLVVVVGTC